MRTWRQIQKRGFTLVETVVTVGIIAALTAVVYPTVVKQFDSADPTRAAEDLSNISTAVETFGVNVRPQQPNDIEDLVLRPVANTDNTDSTARHTLYSSSEAASWNGPYLSISTTLNLAQGATAITTGFGGLVLNRFVLYDVDAAQAGGDTLTAATLAAADFVAVKITGLSGTAYNALNLVIDGPTETSAALRRQSGRLRCPFGTQTDVTACPVAFYFASSFR